MTTNQSLSVQEALEIRELAHRAPIYLSPDGSWIAFSVLLPEQAESVGGAPFSSSGVLQELVGSEVHVQKVGSISSGSLTPGWGSSWGAGWSPCGTKFLLLSDKGGSVRGWLWHTETDEVRLLCDAPICSFFGYDTPIWMPKGNGILIRRKVVIDNAEGSVTDEPHHNPSPSTVAVFSTDDISGLMEEPLSERPTPAGRRVSTLEDRHLYDLVLVEIGTGAMQVLAGGLRAGTIAPSSDGSKVAVLSVSSVDDHTRRRVY